jgi:F-type H+-transporting ATPase subunit gamma
MFTMDPGQLLSDLLRQYLFGGLYRAVAESLASENSARLMAMQRAEDNILDLLDELTNQYHQQRQMNITQEILEVISGFEALK